MYKSSLGRISTTIQRSTKRNFNSLLNKPTINKTITEAYRMAILKGAQMCPVTGNPQVKTGTCPFSGAAKLSATPLPDPITAIPPRFRDVALTEEQKHLIKASAPALEKHGLDITRSFYGSMLEENPSLKDIFNERNQFDLAQPRALAGAVYAYAANIDNLTPLLPTVELIANQHASLYVRPEQYNIVGTYLLQAIQQVLGEAVTPELLSAWEAAYWQLAKILIEREDQLYRETPGATDWMDFKVAKKVRESEEITSFYFEPVDASQKPLPAFLPGQVRCHSLLRCLCTDFLVVYLNPSRCTRAGP
jgi:hemoglobin-like flavoprotein